jgi:hypothetical protein
MKIKIKNAMFTYRRKNYISGKGGRRNALDLIDRPNMCTSDIITLSRGIAIGDRFYFKVSNETPVTAYYCQFINDEETEQVEYINIGPDYIDGERTLEIESNSQVLGVKKLQFSFQTPVENNYTPILKFNDETVYTMSD